MWGCTCVEANESELTAISKNAGWMLTGPQDRARAVNWAQKLDSRNGTDMRQAMEHARRRFPDAREIYVLCDGDVDVFAQGAGAGAGFRAYKDAHWPNATFEFGLLGTGASAAMQEMGTYGGGGCQLLGC